MCVVDFTKDWDGFCAFFISEMFFSSFFRPIDILIGNTFSTV